MAKTSILTIILSFGFLAAQAQTEWTLQKCIDHAFQNNIQIQQSQLNLELSEISKQQSVGTMLPSVNASASHGYNWGQTIDPFTNSFATERIRSNSLGANVSLTLFNGFQNMNSVKQSDIDIEARKADLEKQRNDVALNVSNAFLGVLFQEEFVRIAKANLENTDAQVQRISQLVNAGAAPQGNLLEIQAQRAADQASLISAENNLSISYLNLRQLLRIPETDKDSFVISAPSSDLADDMKLPANAESASSNALNNFPEIRSAEADLVGAETNLKIAKGGMSPRLSMSYSYGSGYSGANQLPVGDPTIGFSEIGFVEGSNDVVLTPNFSYDAFETKAFGDQIRDNINSSLFFSLSVPIFNGFSTKSNIERAQVNLASSNLQLESVKLQLEQAIQSAYADALASLNNFQAGQTTVSSAELAMEYATIRFEEGASNIADYTQARVRLDNARADLIRNKYDYIFRVKVIEFYMGQPLTFR
ncbi:MAG: TolC family protein [Flavobacteriales bacterium]|nr:TolC family protein [Flavobacteriales bacterium]MDG1780710.1 TolC family protein [Flavobacteriales bacterium]MDG2244919.1 TolC family protein [Flavobacteriales bacterium]